MYGEEGWQNENRNESGQQGELQPSHSFTIIDAELYELALSSGVHSSCRRGQPLSQVVLAFFCQSTCSSLRREQGIGVDSADA